MDEITTNDKIFRLKEYPNYMFRVNGKFTIVYKEGKIILVNVYKPLEDDDEILEHIKAIAKKGF